MREYVDEPGGLMTKTMSILQRDGANANEVYFAIEDEGEGDIFIKDLTIDFLTWADLGKPDTITVTIEPGDTLN